MNLSIKPKPKMVLRKIPLWEWYGLLGAKLPERVVKCRALKHELWCGDNGGNPGYYVCNTCNYGYKIK